MTAGGADFEMFREAPEEDRAMDLTIRATDAQITPLDASGFLVRVECADLRGPDESLTSDLFDALDKMSDDERDARPWDVLLTALERIEARLARSEVGS